MSAILCYKGKLSDLDPQLRERGYEVTLTDNPKYTGRGAYLAIKSTAPKSIREMEDDFRDLEGVDVSLATEDPEQAEKVLLHSFPF